MRRRITLHHMRGTDAKQTPYPKRWVATRWVRLSYVLDRIGDATGRSMYATRGPSGGGYCPPGHSPRRRTSQHRAGRACDVKVQGVRPARVHAVILKLRKTNKKFRRLLKGLGLYPRSGFVHVDVRPTKYLRRWKGR